VTIAASIFSVVACLMLLQTIVLIPYWWSYRRANSAVSRREASIIVPAIAPVLFMILWVVRVIDYADGYGWRQSLAWLWWEPFVALLAFAAGHALVHWQRSRLLIEKRGARPQHRPRT
jgi:hypothetical protein